MEHTTNALDTTRAKTEVAEVLRGNQDRISARTQVYMERNVGLIARLFPGRMGRLVNQQELLDAHTDLEFRHKLLQLSLDFQLSAITERFEGWLKVIKVECRQRFIDFVTNRQAELRKAIDERRVDYLKDSQQRYDLWQQYKHLPAGAVYWRSIESEDTEYFHWLGRLLQDFENIVDEKLRSFRG